MHKKIVFSIIHWMMLVSMLLSLIPTGAVLAKSTASPAAAAETAAAAAELAAAKKMAAECGIAAQASMGQDLELLIMNRDTKQSTQLNMNYDWTSVPANPAGGASKIIPVRSETTAAGAALGNDGGVLVWDATDGTNFPSGVDENLKGKVVYQFWSAGGYPGGYKGFDPNVYGFPAMIGSPMGSPVVAALNPARWFVFHRNTSGGIEWVSYSAGAPGAWAPVGGAYIALSDPVPVVVNMNHMLLFFTGKKSSTAATQVFFSEYQGGAWRSQPVELGLPGRLSTVNHITAVAAGDKLAAVFASGPTTQNASIYDLYVREWTSDHALDWGDTSWSLVKNGVGNGPIAATSRTTSNITVAHLTSDLKSLHIREREEGQWPMKSAMNGPDAASGTIQNLALVSPFSDEMMLLVNSKKENYYSWYALQWKKPVGMTFGWGSKFRYLSSDSALIGLQATVRAPHTVFVATNASNSYPYLHDYGNAYRPLSASGNFSNPTPNAISDTNQLVAKVDGKSYWVSLTWTSTQIWRMEARNMSPIGSAAAWTKGSSIDLQDHALSDQGEPNASIAAADMDLDGRDEIVIATINRVRTQIDLSWIRLTPNANGTLTLTKSPVTSLIGLPKSDFVNLAIADADNIPGEGDDPNVPDPDGRRNEVFLAFADSKSSFRVYYYQFAQGADGSYALQARTLEGPLSNYKTIALAHPDGGLGNNLSLRMAAGHTSQSNPGDSLVIMAGNEFAIYQLASTGNSDVRDLRKMSAMAGVRSLYTSRLALGDIDGDSLQEVIFTAFMLDSSDAMKFRLGVASDPLPEDTKALPMFPAVNSSLSNQVLMTGDVDQDGQAEILFYNGDATTTVIRPAPNNTLFPSQTISKRGRPLLADLDNDSLYATLESCTRVGKLTVQTVSFAPPVYYDSSGEPLQSYYGEFGTEAGNSESESSGFTFTVGSSIGVGVEAAQTVPLVGTQMFSMSAMTTLEMMGSVGKSTTETYSTTVAKTQGFYDPSLGQVIYVGYSQDCYRYNLSDPADPSKDIPVTLCSPASQPAQHHITIKDWYDPSHEMRETYGGSWFELPAVYTHNGIPRNDISQYPALNAPPVDEFQVLFDGRNQADIEAVRSSTPTHYDGWSVGTSSSKENAREGTLDVNLTYGVEATIGFLATSFSMTTGVGGNWGSSQEWSSSLHYAGQVFDIPADDCPATTCPGYTITPYIYQAMAKAPDSTYQYVVQDYYRLPNTAPNIVNAEEAAAEASAVAADQPAPMAPIVGSQSHYDQNAWYQTDYADFYWRQPEEDTAEIKGYQWLLNESADITPVYADVVNTNNIFYEHLDQGVYYMHVRAVGIDGVPSPWSLYTIKVDNVPPEVKIELNPGIPSGANGWYTGPVTATISATDEGSGTRQIFYSTGEGYIGMVDLPVTLEFNTNTPEFTLWAYAEDNTNDSGAGNISETVTTNIKVDLDAPSITDVDGNKLSYTSIGKAENGNPQLTMGGVLSDDISGRGDVMIKAGENGVWHSVDQVGEFDMLPDNDLTTTQPILNWIYRPSIDVRGIYPLYGYGIDQAGNATTPEMIGIFRWEPEARPNFVESAVSASKDYAQPGDGITFTISARNTGYQESLVKVTDTLPAGLNILPGSIDEGGVYDPATGTITWQIGALWPGQTRYLHFSATVAPSVSLGALTNQVDLEGYWEWMNDPAIPAEPAHEFFTTTHQINIVETGQEVKPSLTSVSIIEGLAVSRPGVTLALDTGSDSRYLYVKEWTWNTENVQWVLAQESGWVPLAESDKMTVQTSADGTRALYKWSLLPADGVHYLGVWVANEKGDANNLNEGSLLYTNLVSNQVQPIAKDQRIQYRFPLEEGQLAVFNLIMTQGDGDLYVWSPRQSNHPTYFSNAVTGSSGILVEPIAFFAEETGVYIVEIQGISEGDTLYQLAIASVTITTEMNSFTQHALGVGEQVTQEESVQAMLEMALADELPSSIHTTAAKRNLPAQVLTLSTPLGLTDVLALPGISGDVPVVPDPDPDPDPDPVTNWIYLPIIRN